jgi:hypothetical protein
MGNWKRLGFDMQDPWDQPTSWVCGVVNNRADRVPRSKVFAKIIVEDMNADRFFLIGNNLSGLKAFIQEAWDEKAKTLSLCERGQPWQTDFAIQAFRQAARDFRQAISAEQIQQKLRCMLDAVSTTLSEPALLEIDAAVAKWDDPAGLTAILKQGGASLPLIQAVAKHQTDLTTALREYQEMLEVIQKATPHETEHVGSQYVQLLEKWYFRKLITVHNYDASGEEVVSRIVDETPPGFLNRTIGLQNIKGTGLDFVYRFQAWDICFEACRAAESDDPDVAGRGLQALLGMPVIGQLCLERVREVVSNGKTSKTLRRADLQSLLEQLETKLMAEQTDDRKDSSSVQHGSRPGAADRDLDRPTDKEKRTVSLAHWNKWLIDTSEEVLDVNDSLRRRDTADAIYRDLSAGRISRQRAVSELRSINKRQKGGWLTSWMATK